MRLTLVTPVHPARAAHLDQAARSVAQLRSEAAPGDLGVEWIIVQDGGALDALPPLAHAVSDVAVRLEAPCGISACRNVATAHSTGEWILPLDADDVLIGAGVLEACDAAARASDSTGWIATNRLLLDGSHSVHWNAHGRWWSRGQLALNWTTPFPFHPNSVIIRRRLLLAVGGWPALPAIEDMALVLRISEEDDGEFIPIATLRYRSWTQQETAGLFYASHKAQSLSAIEGFLNAQRTLHGRSLVVAPKQTAAFGTIKSDV